MTEEQLQRLRRILAEQGSQPESDPSSPHEFESIPAVPLEPALEDKLVATALRELNKSRPTLAPVEPAARSLRRMDGRRRRRRLWGAALAVAAAVVLFLGLRGLGPSDSGPRGAGTFLGADDSATGGGGESLADVTSSRRIAAALPRHYELMVRRQDGSLGEGSSSGQGRMQVTPRSQLVVTVRATSPLDEPLQGRAFLASVGQLSVLPVSVNPDEQSPGVLTMQVDLSRAAGVVREGTLVFSVWPSGSLPPPSDRILAVLATGMPPAEPWRVLTQDIGVVSR